MKIAIVGSRQWGEPERVRDFVRGLPEDAVVITGGAHGVDQLARSAATARGLRVVVIPPDYATHGHRAPLIRNETIAQQCDRMVAFHDGVSRGTLHVTGCARRMGKPVEVHGPDRGDGDA